MYLKLRIQYDGTEFSGSQLQSEGRGRTVQGELEGALARLAGEPVRANLAGRTDAGVHAWGQVASLDFPARPRLEAPEAVKRALNGILPADLSVLAAEEVNARFHARFSATRRCYRYLVWNAQEPLPLIRRYSLHVRRPLDAKAMSAAAGLLVGTHDLASFAGQGMGVPQEADSEDKSSTVRTVDVARLQTVEPNANFWAWEAPDRGRVEDALTDSRLLALDLVANAFLPQMIRTIVGTLLEVGEGKRTVEEMKHIIESRDRRLAGPTAKPQGLCLLWVSY
ncbi:MAG: tRNA pseudouridine(38-40) synthase TruA [Chloroflexota bacterium]|nr:tRNA pseudouridine(38-40) synthase TruA [Chloroflexota bacterium]MDQ5867013.1 tRNA pseudouridine(38-40) synthase TruA [Chloroflexota bacterium]